MKINVGFLVAYDYEFLKIAIPLIYKSADKIVLAIDENLNTWSGNFFEINESFFDWLTRFDTDKKIVWFKENFYIPENTAMQNETRERNMLAEFMGEGICLQLDADEFMLNFDGLVAYLKQHKKKLLGKKKVQICGFLTNVFKKLDDGYLFVNEVSPFYLGSNAPDYVRGRKNRDQQKWYIPFQIIHMTWGRDREELKLKIKNWGHNTDFDSDKFLSFWDSINKKNHKSIKGGFHPFSSKYWKELKFVEGKNIPDVIKNKAFPILVSDRKRKLKNIGQSIKYFFKRKKLIANSEIKNIENKKSIVFFNKYIPEYNKGSGANRFNEIVKELLKKEYKITLIAKRGKEKTEYIRHYEQMGLQVFCCEKSRINYQRFLKENIHRIDFVWFYGPNSFKTYYTRFLLNRYKSAKLIYDMIDIHHLRFQRALEMDDSDRSLKRQIKKYTRMELDSVQKADIILTISEKEKEYMSQYVSLSKIKVLSNIHNPKINIKEVNSFDNRSDIVFIGSGHAPNIDALDFLYNGIMPLVWKDTPEIRVHIIGNVIDKTTFIKDERFVLHGFVEDVSDIFNSVKMMVVPLRYGAGVKGKLGHAFEYALPVVSTRIGSEGMFLKNNEHLLKADDRVEFAQGILKLYNDKTLWNELSQKSFKSLEPFGKKQVSQLLESIDTN